MGIGNLLGLARESIAAQGFALNVTGQNIANASTPGYVRRDAMLEGVVAGTQTYGGVRASGIHRSVDSFLDARTYEAGSFQSSAQTRDQALSSIENLFNDAAGTGLSNSLTALASSMSALASNPSDTTTRAVLLSNADQFASRIRETSNQLATQRSDLLTQAKGTVASVNEYASQIAKLNSRNFAHREHRGDAADLKDQRDNLVTKLSGSINVHVITDGTGKLVISAGGSTLVEGDRAASLSISTQIRRDSSQPAARGRAEPRYYEPGDRRVAGRDHRSARRRRGRDGAKARSIRLRRRDRGEQPTCLGLWARRPQRAQPVLGGRGVGRGR